ncbi:protein adenylyltransferase SelO family protein [Sorangium sp. So ce291]|uniref:protein adenylyltransferase SelO family protein n=1 Tax=Sorangium sp. So ce291 TaxID=3133294 RepID=UPI003F5DDDD6
MRRNCWQSFNDARISTPFSDLCLPAPRILELVGYLQALSSRRCLLGARGPGSRRWPQLLPVRAAPRRRLRPCGRGARTPARPRGKGRERTPWSRARTGHGRLALKRRARDVLAAGTLEALGVTASRSLTQAVRDGRGALANTRAAHRASSNGESHPVCAGKLNAPAEARERTNRVGRSRRHTAGTPGFLSDPEH